MESSATVYRELWVSLASLLRSYSAVHGLNRKEQATVELGEDTITVRTGIRWLALTRQGPEVHWKRDNQASGSMRFTIEGTLRAESGDEEEMDMQAEAWARELML
jgi:hypothetical protein